MKPKNTYGWEQLNCPFFTSVCRRVLSPYLSGEGFVEKETGSIGEIIYKRFEVFLKIGYDAATCPNYSPGVVFGLGDRLHDVSGHLAGVPMWFALPSDHPYTTKIFWTFKTEADLERVLTEIKEQFLEPYAKPLWLNRARLEKSIANFHAGAMARGIPH